jgi:hypothetical protein
MYVKTLCFEVKHCLLINFAKTQATGIGVFAANGQGVVFFDDADTLFEEVGVGGNTFFSSDKHDGFLIRNR